MGKIYCLLGKSGSGKSTIEKLLEKKGLKRIVSTTTRPMREGEIEGIDYHFVNEWEFYNFSEQGNFLERSSYNNWRYAIDKEYNKIDLEKPEVKELEYLSIMKHRINLNNFE